MTITNVGYDGTVSDVEFAQLSQHTGALVPVVCGRTDFAVTVNTGGTLTCNVAAGSAEAPGVLTVSDATASVAFDAVSTSGQTRWDAVVLRRNWSTGASTLVVVKGTAAVAAPQILPAGVDLVLDSAVDQVLALVQITNGQPLPTQVVDKRAWGSKSFTVPASTALPTPTAALYGMVAETVGGERYRCLLDSGGNPAWLSATLIETPTSDSGYPTGIPTFSATYPVDRLTIAAVPFARTAHMVTHCHVTTTVTGTQANLTLYAGSTIIGAARRALAAGDPDQIVATGSYDIPAGTAVVFEARVNRFSGTGLLTTSATARLTNTNMLLIAKG